jgi:hypothetical protein
VRLPSLAHHFLDLILQHFRTPPWLDPIEVFRSLYILRIRKVVYNVLLRNLQYFVEKVFVRSARQVFVLCQPVDPVLVICGQRGRPAFVQTDCVDVLNQMVEGRFDRKSFWVHALFFLLFIALSHNFSQPIKRDLVGLGLLHVEARDDCGPSALEILVCHVVLLQTLTDRVVRVLSSSCKEISHKRLQPELLAE